jgi:hypothetical protein
MSGASGPLPKHVKNASRNEKYRKRRADGLLRHQQGLAEKQAEIDHLQGSLTGVLGQLANFEGVAEIIRDYQKAIEPWDDNEAEPGSMMEYMVSSGVRAEMEIARLTAICRKTDCGPLENEVVRLRAQIITLEEGNAQIKTLEAEKADLQAEKADQAAEHEQDFKEI